MVACSLRVPVALAVFAALAALTTPRSSAELATNHWSFQPIRQPALPDSHDDDGNTNAIDAFIRHRLRKENLSPSPQADRVTLIRRLSLDLIGLPPSPDEVGQFVNDTRPDAIGRLIERLLASPQYGERWARPWLDLCHYADSDGYLTDQLRPVAWRYRVWLVDALNDNLPFDQFTIEQLAGDLLPEAIINQRIATGFLRQTHTNREGGANLEEFRVKQVVDRTEMVGAIWLGLTIGCARCHDHKYDPLSQREFFELYACLNNADEVNVDAPLPEEREAWLASRNEYQRRRRALIDPTRTKVEALQKLWEEKCLHAWKHPGQDALWDRQWELLGLVWGGNLGEGQLEGAEIVKLDWSLRTSRQKDDLLDFALLRIARADAKMAEGLRLGELKSKLEKLKSEFPEATRAPIVRAAQTPRPTYMHLRGDFRDRGAAVRPASPACLPRWPATDQDPRLALARWIVSDDNPLTARVTVNRVWQEFFGRGLVRTSDDFGTRGERPSHPELLDWLATWFIESGWDVKALHRLIVTSATYRQSSRPRAALQSRDPHNVYLARQHSLRVPAETIRDMGLAVSGLLYPKLGGPSVKPPQPASVTMEAFGNHAWKPSPPPECYRRGLYTFIIRTAPFAQTATFDAPNPNEVCVRRGRSNTPLQALTLLNDPLFFEMARAMAHRVLAQNLTSDDQRVDFAFRLCMARSPSPTERQRLSMYLASQKRTVVAAKPQAVRRLAGEPIDDGRVERQETAWTNLCSVLLNLHEFITRD